MELRFWGVRGSIASPGPNTIEVGGNTTCLSLRYDDYIFIFDAGTGVRALGEYLNAETGVAWRGSIFLSHYHWDHIQGLPFFGPARCPDNEFALYGERKNGEDIAALLGRQMEGPFFPITMAAAPAFAKFIVIEPGETVEPYPGFAVHTQALLHPNGAVGFRVQTPDGSLCIITDHEHPADGLDAGVVEFARGASVLVHDAQYTPEEKKGPKAGWGHSSWEEAALTAREADVGQLFLSHHDPARKDADVFAIRDQARAVFERTEVATESTVFTLPGETSA